MHLVDLTSMLNKPLILAIFKRFVWVVSLFACAAWGQTVPNAGSVLQQIEREQPGLPLQPLARAPAPSAGRVRNVPGVGPMVVLQAFKFQGNTLLSEAQLTAAVAEYVNQPIAYGSLKNVPNVVMDLYRKGGWLASAVLPSQDITDGELVIVIQEATVGAVVLEGGPTERVSQDRVLAIVQQQQPAGSYLNLGALDRALLLADDLPGASVSGSLREGAAEGQTDLVLQLRDRAKWLTNISSDNTGALSTGANRILGNVTLNSPSGQGDLANLSLMASGGTAYVRGAYSLPLGYDGWRMGLNVSRLNYGLNAAGFEELNAKGSSDTSGWELSYPIIRSRTVNVNANLGADFKKFFNESGGQTVSSYSSEAWSLALSANGFDDWAGGGSNAVSVAFSSGVLHLSGSPNQASDEATTQTDGGFRKVRYTLSRQQNISGSWSLLGSLSGQWSDKNLDSSEKFYLGGSAGVRAYPSSEGGGAWGQLATLELRYQWGGGVTLAGFQDFGQVKTNPNNDFVGAPALNEFALRGTGVSFAWQNATGMNLKAVVAQRVGSNPNATPAGMDQDGTLTNNRLWLSASLDF